MDAAMQVALVALAVATGLSEERAWQVVDDLPDVPARELTRLLIERANALAWTGDPRTVG